MPIEAAAQIVITGSSEALKQLQGVKREVSALSKETKQAAKAEEKAKRDAQRAAEAAEKAKQKAAEASAKAQQKAAQETARVQAKAAQDAARAAAKAHQEMERAAEKEAKRWRDLARQSLNERMRAEREATRAAQQEAARRRQRVVGAVGAVTAGVLAGGAVAMNTGRQVTGVKDLRERISSANEFNERLFLTTSQAGYSAEQREDAKSKVLGASAATGKDIGELMAVLETGQSAFNNLKFFADNIKEIATVSKVANADTGEFATALGFAQQAFGLTGDQAMEAAYLMKASADKGSVEVKNLARDFASSMSIYAMNTKQTGIEGFRQFLGVAQSLGTGGFGTGGSQAETATRMERFITDLNDLEVQAGLRSAGVTVGIDKSTGKIDVASVIDQLATSTKFEKSAVRQDIFKDIRGLQAVEALVAARKRVMAGTGTVDINTIAAVESRTGRDAIASTFAGMQGEDWFKAQQEAARQQIATFDNLSKFNADALKAAEAAGELEKAFGRLAPWVNAVAAAGAGSVITAVGGKVLGIGGGAAAGTAAAGTAAGAGGAGVVGGLLAKGALSVGAAGAGAVAATIGAGLLIGGAIGTGLDQGSGLVSKDGKKLSDYMSEYLWDMFQGDEPTRATGRGLDAPAINANGEVVKVLEKMIRVQESIDRKTGTGPTADGGAPRGPT